MALPASAESELFLLYVDGGHRIVFPMLGLNRGLKEGEMKVMLTWLNEQGKNCGLADRALAQQWEEECGACLYWADKLESYQ